MTGLRPRNAGEVWGLVSGGSKEKVHAKGAIDACRCGLPWLCRIRLRYRKARGSSEWNSGDLSGLDFAVRRRGLVAEKEEEEKEHDRPQFVGRLAFAILG